MEDATYSLFSVNYHDRTSMSAGQYFCDIFDFNIGMCWRCDYYNITQLIGIPENVYIVARYLTAGNIKQKHDESFREYCFYAVFFKSCIKLLLIHYWILCQQWEKRIQNT